MLNNFEVLYTKVDVEMKQGKKSQLTLILEQQLPINKFISTTQHLQTSPRKNIQRKNDNTPTTSTLFPARTLSQLLHKICHL